MRAGSSGAAWAAVLLAAAGAWGQTAVNAARYGFNAEDATEALQAAIDSKARTVVVPYMGEPWIIRPVKLRGDLELIFEPGVLVLAKKGEFQGTGDSLFTASGVSNLVIRGYGATLRMRKRDYQNPPYKKAEWRMGIALRNSSNVLVEGVRVESSGGDGFYVDGGENITIRNAVAHDNHRQGISVISAQNLLVENCVFSGTSGTAPEAGIDLEPDTADQRLVNCVIRNCVFENNSGHAMLVYLRPLKRTSQPVSVRFENCVARMGAPGMRFEDFHDMAQRGWAGMAVGAAGDDGPQGAVEFINCTAENTGKEGARIFDKSAGGVRVRFVNCNWKNPWVSAHREAAEPRAPVLIQLRRSSITSRPGGIDFEACHVYDYAARPAVVVDQDPDYPGVFDLRGLITVRSPAGARVRLGPRVEGVTLQVVEAPR
jgi:parallel beta-helix repeat protein